MISPRFQILLLSHLTSFQFDVMVFIYFCIFLDLTTNVKVQCARYSGALTYFFLIVIQLSSLCFESEFGRTGLLPNGEEFSIFLIIFLSCGQNKQSASRPLNIAVKRS